MRPALPGGRGAASLLLALIVTGCALPTPAEPAIRETNRRLQEAFNRGDAAAVAELYAEDARFLPPGAPAAIGRIQIRDALEGLIRAGATGLALESAEIEARGDLAFERGVFRITLPGGDGAPVERLGKYLVIWGRRHDGGWSPRVDLFNFDAPAEAAAHDDPMGGEPPGGDASPGPAATPVDAVIPADPDPSPAATAAPSAPPAGKN